MHKLFPVLFKRHCVACRSCICRWTKKKNYEWWTGRQCWSK